MKSREILARLSADPMAEFAYRVSEYDVDVCLIRGLTSAGRPGVWRYGEVKYAGRADWSIPWHDDPRLVSSRDLVDSDEARKAIALREREPTMGIDERRAEADAVRRLDALGVRAGVNADGGVLVFGWRELLALLESDQ